MGSYIVHVPVHVHVWVRKYFASTPWTIVRGFRPEFKYFGKNDTIGKGISRGAERHKFELSSTFQRVATCMGVEKIHIKTIRTIIVHGFGQNLKNSILAYKDAITKAASKRSIMVQI